MATLKVNSLKDVREAMSYDQKYLYYKEITGKSNMHRYN